MTWQWTQNTGLSDFDDDQLDWHFQDVVALWHSWCSQDQLASLVAIVDRWLHFLGDLQCDPERVFHFGGFKSSYLCREARNTSKFDLDVLGELIASNSAHNRPALSF